MKALITTYENSRAGLQKRIHELNAALRDPMLRTREREQLEERRALLTIESTDLMHIITDLRQH